MKLAVGDPVLVPKATRSGVTYIPATVVGVKPGWSVSVAYASGMREEIEWSRVKKNEK